MSNQKESFETLEDGTGSAFALTLSFEGDAASAKNAAAFLNHKDSANKLKYPLVDGSNHTLVAQGNPAASANAWPVSIASSVVGSTRNEYNQQIINGNGFSVVTGDGAVSVNGVELAAFYFKNNGTKTVYLFNTFVVIDPGVTGNWLEARYYLNPTVTANGTAQTVNNLLAGSLNTSGVNAYVMPTVTAKGNLINLNVNGYNNTSGPAQRGPYEPYMIIPPAQSFLITGLAKGNNTGLYIVANWFEV